MQKLKLISDNAALRATITVTPIVAGMSAAALQSDVYSNVCRSPGTTMTISLVWPVAERIGGLRVLGNWSPTTTMRVLGYSDAAGTTQILDTGIILACPWAAIKLLGSWTAATSASAYSYGGGAEARAWFANTAVKRLDVQLVDVNSLQGYPEASHVFLGEWWTPDWNFDYDPGLTAGSTGVSFVDASGRLRSTRGTKFRQMSLNLSHMTEADRAAMWGVASGNGTEVPFFLSLYPNDVYPARERDHQLYCCLVSNAAVRRKNSAEHGTSMEVRSV